jgi:hypothetical protein
MQRLVRCPFCNGREVSMHTIYEPDGTEYTCFECECGAVTQFNTKMGVPVTQSASVQRWNRRALNLCN